MIICHSHDIHHSLWGNLSRQNSLTMEINRASNLLENQIGYLEALCFTSDTNLFHPPATIYILSYTCCKKTRGWYGHREPKKFERSTINRPKPNLWWIPKAQGECQNIADLGDLTTNRINPIGLSFTGGSGGSRGGKMS